MAHYYILDGHKPVECENARKWALNEKNRRVAEDKINGVYISTVFLGINHQLGDGPPILFETMIFGGEHKDYQTRCSTWEQAEEMHRTAIKFVLGWQ